MDFPHGETVEVLTPAVDADPYSGEAGTPGSSVMVDGVAVEPRPVGTQSGGEPLQDARNSVTSGFTLYMPPGTPVTSASRVRVRGEVYEVLGEPSVWRSPFTGWEPGLVVQASRTEG